MMKKTPRGGQSNLPVPKASKGSPGNAKSTLSKGGSARSAEDIPRRVQLSFAGGGGSPAPPSPQRRAISPGTPQRRSLLPSPVPGQNGQQGGVRYITEDLIRKICKEDSLEMITTLNLTLTKSEAGKKIRYIENLDRLKRLQVLILSSNILEKIEKLDKLLKLKELDLSSNCIVKIEGLENLTNLQILNLSGNLIEHIPIWMGKRLKSLRAFYIGRNRLESLSELAKLKPLPDLSQMTVAENPLAEFNHCRPYLVFHLRTLEVIDGQAVTERERTAARDRFEQDEVERLEKQLENEEAKYRRLEEDHNRSKQEHSHLSMTEDDMKKREKLSRSRMEEMEREMETKNDLLKKKTSELNKACEKHYQLEQELAFYKIDSKFDSLGRGPEQSLDETGDDGGLLGESPYIGRARYKANRTAGESEILGQSPSRAQLHSLPSPMRADVKMEINHNLDHEIAAKEEKVAKANTGVREEKSSTVKVAEDRLKRLTNELAMTENKLKQATKDLKGIGDSASAEKDEKNQVIRQKMARKMRSVNEMKDSATQIEEEVEKTKTAMHRHKMEMNKLKDQLNRMDKNDPSYRRVYAEMVDKEQQINESGQVYGQLQDQLELMLDTIAKETNDIKNLEQKLNEDTLETNESLREELDDIVGGLQTYLAQVQTKAAKKEKEFDQVLRQNEDLQDKLRKMESELGVVDQEAAGLRELERKYAELEHSFQQADSQNRELQDQIQRSRRQDMNTQDTLENKQLEVASLKKALKDLEHKAKADKHSMEKQLQAEKAKAIDGDRKAKEAQRKDDEVRKLMSQLETVRAQNVALKDRVEHDTQTLQSKIQDSTPNTELKRRLKDLAHSFKQNKVSIEPESSNDALGKTFRDLQGFVQDKLNKSTQDMDTTRTKLNKTDLENQSLQEQLKRLEGKLNKRDEKVKNEKSKFREEAKSNLEEIKRLGDENQRLKNALKEAKNRSRQTKIVHEEDGESVFSRRSSLNTEEKHLFDELQNELMSLKRVMRTKEDDATKRIIDAETEAAMLEQNLQDKEESYQHEIERLKEHMEMQRDRQEARMQVIAADLDQAKQVADFLQGTLDNREHQLHSELQQSDMNNQMITTQEDELAKLYDILEAQREELNRLNGMLDNISGQGGSLGTAGADDELWRLRQEVNNLKETLAMQSAYVQTMPPPSSSAGVQASTGTGPQYFLTDHGTAAGPVYRPMLSQHRDQQMSMVPPVKNQATMGTSYGPPGYTAPQGVGVGVGASFAPAQGMGVGTGMAMGPGMGVGMGTGAGMPMGPGGYPMGQGARSPEAGPAGGGARTPPGGQPAGRSRHSHSPSKRHADRGPVARDQSPSRKMAQPPTGADDTYLFCNVPEHHDLEDYIAELQEKLKKLRARIANEKKSDILEKLERRDELEGLDLAIERQQKNLKNLKGEERRLHFERQSAKEELEFTRDQNAKKKRKMRVYTDDEDSFDERMENSRKKIIKDEIRCLEQTLAKRKAQLREADRLLKECNTDLKCAREEARVTVSHFDKATMGLESTVKETSELEKRANLAGVELIKATEKLNALRREIKDSDSKRGKQERLLRDVTQLISKRDAEFKDVDSRSKATQQNLSRLQAELTAAAAKERDTVQALRDSEDVLAKRRNEISRMRDQIDQGKHELEKVDHQMGKKRTELQFLTDNLERKQAEINQLIRDTEGELSSNKRDIKEQRDLLRNMEVQKLDLSQHIKSKRSELQKMKDEIDTSDEILQKLVNSVSKHKSDLKHTFEMQRLEQTELDNLKSQHAQRLSDLEKTQRELIDEKNALDQLNSDVNKKATEFERLRGCIERDREDVERLAMEKQSYEDRISTMSREKEMLDESLKTLDTKVAHMRRSQNTMEEKIDSTSRRLDTLEQERQRQEREMDDLEREKAILQKDVGNLKNSIKDGKNELKGYKEHIRDAEKTIGLMEQQLRETNVQRDEAKLEMERLNEAIRQSRITHDDCIRQQRQREEELQDLVRIMDEREIEYQETRKSLNKVRKEVEKEESKLQKKEAEKMELGEKKLTECEHKIRELKQEVQDRNEEKNELAKALTRSYEELQKLRTESAQEQERLTMDRMTLENTLRDMQGQMEHAKKEIQQMQTRSNSQVRELQTIAEELFNRANKLSDELARIRTKKSSDQSQATLSDVTNQNAEKPDHHGDTEQPTNEQTNIIKTKSHDKGHTPSRSLPEVNQQSGTGFREYLNLEPHAPVSSQGYNVPVSGDRSFNLLENSLTWPPDTPDLSFLVSGSPIRGSPILGTPVRAQDRTLTSSPTKGLEFQGGARIKVKRNESVSPIIQRGRSASVKVRSEPHSPFRVERSSQPHPRDRSWSPPSFRERPVITAAKNGSRQLPQRRDFDSYSLPDLSFRTYKHDLDKGLDPSTHKATKVKVTTSVIPNSFNSDTSSTLTSTVTTPIPSHRDPREVMTPRSDPMTLGRGQSPPVRDSGSSLTTVTTLNDQQTPGSARSGPDRRFSFDLGFLDILTVDSNSSVADQLSTGRTTDRFSDDKENLHTENSEDQRKSDSSLREKLSKEQETLRMQLQQQMQRHADAMEVARLQSEGTIENLRKKLNTLQDVLLTTADITSPTLRRARSSSAGLISSPERQRSPSPIYRRHGYLAQRPRSRSRSADRISRAMFSERDLLTV